MHVVGRILRYDGDADGDIHFGDKTKSAARLRRIAGFDPWVDNYGRCPAKKERMLCANASDNTDMLFAIATKWNVQAKSAYVEFRIAADRSRSPIISGKWQQ